MASEWYTIGRLARAAGVATSTVRYYERRGLLLPDARTKARYRSYGRDSLARLRFIRTHRHSGLTLGNIARLLELAEGRTAPLGPVRRMITERLVQIDRTLNDLTEARRLLAACLIRCEGAARGTIECPGSAASRGPGRP